MTPCPACHAPRQSIDGTLLPCAVPGCREGTVLVGPAAPVAAPTAADPARVVWLVRVRVDGRPWWRVSLRWPPEAD